MLPLTPTTRVPGFNLFTAPPLSTGQAFASDGLLQRPRFPNRSLSGLSSGLAFPLAISLERTAVYTREQATAARSGGVGSRTRVHEPFRRDLTSVPVLRPATSYFHVHHRRVAAYGAYGLRRLTAYLPPHLLTPFFCCQAREVSPARSGSSLSGLSSVVVRFSVWSSFYVASRPTTARIPFLRRPMSKPLRPQRHVPSYNDGSRCTPERVEPQGFEPWSSACKAGALPIELWPRDVGVIDVVPT